MPRSAGLAFSVSCLAAGDAWTRPSSTQRNLGKNLTGFKRIGRLHQALPADAEPAIPDRVADHWCRNDLPGHLFDRLLALRQAPNDWRSLPDIPGDNGNRPPTSGDTPVLSGTDQRPASVHVRSMV